MPAGAYVRIKLELRRAIGGAADWGRAVNLGTCALPHSVLRNNVHVRSIGSGSVSASHAFAAGLLQTRKYRVRRTGCRTCAHPSRRTCRGPCFRSCFSFLLFWSGLSGKIGSSSCGLRRIAQPSRGPQASLWLAGGARRAAQYSAPKGATVASSGQKQTTSWRAARSPRSPGNTSTMPAAVATGGCEPDLARRIARHSRGRSCAAPALRWRPRRRRPRRRPLALAGGLAGWLVAWLADWLPGWLAGWLMAGHAHFTLSRCAQDCSVAAASQTRISVSRRSNCRPLPSPPCTPAAANGVRQLLIAGP